MDVDDRMTGYPSIDKPWLKYYSAEASSSNMKNCTLYEYLYECNKQHLDDVALLYFDKRIIYSKMLHQIDTTANAFAHLGIKQGDIVTLCTVTTPETIYAFYALNKLGAISNMVDPRTSEDGIKHYLAEARSKVLIVLDVVYPKIDRIIVQTDVEYVIVISAGDSMPTGMKVVYRLMSGRTPVVDSKNVSVSRWMDFIEGGQNGQAAPYSYVSGAPTVIVHTGGTTGVSKGVLFSDDSYNHLLSQLQYSGVAPGRQQRFLNIMPPFIAYGLMCGIHTPLCSGAQLILVPQFDPKKFDKLILKYRPHHFWGVPTHFDNLLESKKLRHINLSFLICAGVGGDGLNTATEAHINDFLFYHHCRRKVIKGYGMTELNSAACACTEDVNRIGSVGIPFVHTIISVFSPGTQQELKYNELGEICVTGPATMLEYFNNPEETQRVLQTHADGRKWMHSGDIGYITEDGLIYIVDRIKRMIIRADGFKVYPSVIENTIRQHSAVESCAVVGVGVEGYSQGRVPKAYIVLRQEARNQQRIILDEIEQICQKELAEYALPSEYMVLNQMPLTSIGKIDFRALEDYL